MKATLDELKEVFRSEVDKRVAVMEFDPDVSYMQQGVDSLDRSSVFFTLEEKYGIHFADSEVSELDTYNKILNYINSKSE